MLCCTDYPDTYYQISIRAHNEIGLSDEDSIIVRTAKGMVNVTGDQLYG
jgi:hypothetical protein